MRGHTRRLTRSSDAGRLSCSRILKGGCSGKISGFVRSHVHTHRWSRRQRPEASKCVFSVRFCSMRWNATRAGDCAGKQGQTARNPRTWPRNPPESRGIPEESPENGRGIPAESPGLEVSRQPCNPPESPDISPEMAAESPGILAESLEDRRGMPAVLTMHAASKCRPATA